MYIIVLVPLNKLSSKAQLCVEHMYGHAGVAAVGVVSSIVSSVGVLDYTVKAL